jgi:hypothetical protein
MAAKKGRPKPKNSGIKKGQKIKKTIQWEDWGKALVDGGMPYLQTELKRMERERDFETWSEHFYRILEYFKPKLARTELSGPNNGPIEVKEAKIKLD